MRVTVTGATSARREYSRSSTAVAVVIPCYRVKRHLVPLIARIGPEVDSIYLVDDACPEGSTVGIADLTSDPRIRVLRHDVNQGVGGAVLTGYSAALANGADILVKLDGDGQMDPGLIPALIQPIVGGEADYAKGNRFFDLRGIHAMPKLRIFGNLGLSFLSKLSTGYWDIFDPTNGFTAIHANVARRLPFESISRRYFFETDILFRLNTLRAVVIDVPMDAAYGDEESGLRVSEIFGEFLAKHLRNTCKRIFYNYFLRDLSVASIELLAGVGLLTFGVSFGSYNWLLSASAGAPTPVGTIMIVTVALVTGLQFLLAFLGYDIASTPRRPIHGFITAMREQKKFQTRPDHDV